MREAALGYVDWEQKYQTLARKLPVLAASSRLTMVGFSAFVDASVRLHEANALFESDLAPARALGTTLLERAATARGGEIAADWADGDSWLSGALTHESGAGGTALQVANMLAMVGAPVLLALADRSEQQLAVVEGKVGLALADGTVAPRSSIKPSAPATKPRHWIFEALAGATVAGVAVARSTRTIVRLASDGPERDEAFERASVNLAASAGAAAISSLVATPDDQVDDTIAYVSALARAWRAAGLDVLHFEFADYGKRPRLPHRILDALTGSVTSIGMSLSEWLVLAGDRVDLFPTMREYAERWNLRRLCIHADGWAVAITLDSPHRERDALMMGSLLASARAEAGRPVLPGIYPKAATFAEPPPARSPGGNWHAISCSSPYLRHPQSTVGLGDTFLAGCLMILGQPADTSYRNEQET